MEIIMPKKNDFLIELKDLQSGQLAKGQKEYADCFFFKSGTGLYRMGDVSKDGASSLTIVPLCDVRGVFVSPLPPKTGVVLKSLL